MSLPTPTLQFDFKSIDNGDQLTDLSGNGFSGTVQGNCTLVHDPVMGNCLQFDGSTGFVSIVQLPGAGVANFSKGFTVAAWVKWDQFNHNARMIDFGNGSAQDNIIFYTPNAGPNLTYVNYVGSSGWADQNIPVDKNNWHHVVVTVDSSGLLTVYKDGVKQGSATSASAIPKTTVRKQNFIGKSNWAGDGFFQGKMGWLSVYNQALTPTQVLADMAQGQQKATQPSRQSFPVDFSLNTDNDGSMVPVLFIENDDAGSDLYLKIQNTSGGALTLEAPSSNKPSASNFHFQLRFRPGVLSENYLKNNQVTIVTDGGGSSAPTWQTFQGQDAKSGVDYISFLCTKNQPQIAIGDKYQIVLKAVSADPMGGARGTNVELGYDQVGPGTPTGSRMQHLSIVNHRGQKNIPLHVDIVGSNTILNDGQTPNSVLLRITNWSNHDLPLSNEAGQLTTFTVSLTGQPKGQLMEWALSDMDNLSKVQLQWAVVGVLGARIDQEQKVPLSTPLLTDLSQGTVLQVNPPAVSSGEVQNITLASKASSGATSLYLTEPVSLIEGSHLVVAVDGNPAWNVPTAANVGSSTVDWKVTNAHQNTLKAGGSLNVVLSNIVSDLATGNAAITVGYFNFPGYWDGQFVVSALKSPLSIQKGQVGILTKPEGILELKGEDNSELIFGQNSKNAGTIYSNDPISLDSNTGELQVRKVPKSSIPSDPDLIAFFKFGQTITQYGSQVIPNVVSDDINAQVNGSGSFGPDPQMGSALTFNGSNTRVQLYFFTIDMMKGVEFSVEGWYYFDQLSNDQGDYAPLFSTNSWTYQGGNSNHNRLGFGLYLKQGGLSATFGFQHFDGNNWLIPQIHSEANAQIPTGQWVHIASSFSFSPSQQSASFYVNGQLKQASVTYTSDGSTSVIKQADFFSKYLTCTQFKFGQSYTYFGNDESPNVGSNNYFKGKMACARIYNRPLSATEVQEHMKADSPASPIEVLKLGNPGNLQINGGVAPPANGISGSDGTRLVLWPGTKSSAPISLGIDGGTLWYGIPDINGCSHKWYAGANMKMQLDTGGVLKLNGTAVQTSDKRMKKNIKELDPEESLKNINKIQTHEYEMKKAFASPSREKLRGFIAQDLKKVMPHSVVVNKGDKAGSEDTHYVDHNAILTEAVGAIKALSNQVKELNAKVKKLEAKTSKTRKP